MATFQEYLYTQTRDLPTIAFGEALERLSNWSYLHISFMEDEPTVEELELLMYVELLNKRRKQILMRLYTRWQKATRHKHYTEMGIHGPSETE